MTRPAMSARRVAPEDEATLPHARRDRLIVEELPDEVLVYDLTRDRAHCLNRGAALVWRHCDGATTVEEMAARLQHELHMPIDQDVIWLALDQLNRAHLLEGQIKRPPRAGTHTRRALLRKVGVSLVAGAVLLPAVTSILAPSVAQAAGCGAPCTNNASCTQVSCPKCMGAPSKTCQP